MAVSAQHNKFVYPDYISALPADIYIQGAVRRQDMYDEGRARVQNQIDTFSQIQNQLVKNVDKQYFEKEMSNLLNEVNKNAGLDFSIKGNFNAVMNIGKPLENNKTLKNAITSSSNYAKMMQEYQNIPAEQRGDANDYFFKKNINQWLSDESVGASLGYSSYTPYDNKVVTAYGEVMDKLKPIKVPKITFTKDGGWIQKEVISSVDQERVMKAYMAAIGDSGRRQLQMDAMYRLETSGRDAISQQLITENKFIYDGLSERIEQIQGQYNQLQSKKDPNNPELAILKDQLDILGKQRDVIAKKVMIDPQQISDGELINYLITDTVTDTSGAYAYKNVELDLQSNPYKLAEYNKSLELANYVQKKQIDMQDDMIRQSMGLASSGGKLAPPPPGAQATTSDLRGEGERFYSSADLFGGFANDQEYNQFMSAFSRHVVGSEPAYNKEGKIIGEKRGKNTIGQVIDRFSNEKNWDKIDSKVISKAFGSQSKAQQFYNKMKEIGSALGIGAESNEYVSALNKLDASLIGKEEEEVENTLNSLFNKHGFTFEQTGAFGDAIIVKAPNGDTKEISLDNFTTSGDTEQAKMIKDFIRLQSPIKTVFNPKTSLYENSEKSTIYPNTEIDPSRTKLIVDYNVQGTEPYSKVMRVEDFLNLNAAQLLSITGISAESSSLVDIPK